MDPYQQDQYNPLNGSVLGGEVVPQYPTDQPPISVLPINTGTDSVQAAEQSAGPTFVYTNAPTPTATLKVISFGGVSTASSSWLWLVLAAIAVVVIRQRKAEK